MSQENIAQEVANSYIERRNWTANDLRFMGTLTAGESDNLKIEVEEQGYPVRVWLARTTVADGEPCNDKISIEVCVDGRWVTGMEYEG